MYRITKNNLAFEYNIQVSWNVSILRTKTELIFPELELFQNEKHKNEAAAILLISFYLTQKNTHQLFA